MSLVRLRDEVTELTNWRTQLRAHQREVLIGAGVAGFVLGGGIAAIGALAFGGGGAGGTAEPVRFSPAHQLRPPAPRLPAPTPGFTL